MDEQNPWKRSFHTRHSYPSLIPVIPVMQNPWKHGDGDQECCSDHTSQCAQSATRQLLSLWHTASTGITSAGPASDEKAFEKQLAVDLGRMREFFCTSVLPMCPLSVFCVLSVIYARLT